MAVPIEKMAAMMQEGAASVVRNATGKGGLPTLVLEHGCGDVAEVYPHGATVTRYLSGGREVLWVSKSAVWDGKKAIRGGIPVVFPQFGPVADDRVAAAVPMAQHGFARTATWDVAETAVTETGACRVVLTLADSDETRAKWPFAFLLRYEVVLDERSLYCELKIANVGREPFAPQCLLHTYLRVEDSKRVMVHGLENAKYVDKLAEDASKLVDEDMPAIMFQGETDRVYQGASREPQPLTVRPEGYRVDAYGAVLDGDGAIEDELVADVVIWNPHVNKSKAMGDFDDDGWKAMCCVEPGVVAADRPVVAPGGALVLSQTLEADGA